MRLVPHWTPSLRAAKSSSAPVSQLRVTSTQEPLPRSMRSVSAAGLIPTSVAATSVMRSRPADGDDVDDDSGDVVGRPSFEHGGDDGVGDVAGVAAVDGEGGEVGVG